MANISCNWLLATMWGINRPMIIDLILTKLMSNLTETNLKVGDPAPSFSGTDENGSAVQISDFQGKKLVLFFYPKDNTPGCTKEVCNLRDSYETLIESGYVLLGVSADSQKKHQNFIKKFDLPFHLLSDPDHQVIQAFGVWGRKKFMGREYDGILRTTFVINEIGVIERIIKKVKTGSHSQQILTEA